MHRGKRKILTAITLLAALAGLSGCSRSVRNYQIAECIGTLGKYENNEPVETPKMKAEREIRESEEALLADKSDAIETARQLAAAYYYQEAIDFLEDTAILADDEEAAALAEECQDQLNSMYEYTGEIGHLSFTNLVIDTNRAFDGDEYSSIYRQNMITLNEFTGILDVLHESGYMLIDLHSIAEEMQDEKGKITMAKVPLKLPKGKKPMVFSIENLTYTSIKNGDGVATRLALDKDGNVGALYTDDGGHDDIGAYDVIPVLEQYIQAHPDFSYRGARGIIGVSGKDGLFGYQIEEETSTEFQENQQTATVIAQKLLADGWTFASEGYSYDYMGKMSYENLRADVNQWQNTVGKCLGNYDTILYPYGSEVDYDTEKASFVINQGFRYMIGSYPGGDFTEVYPTYVRQTRRTVTGYMLENYPSNFTTYFSVGAILDGARR